MTKEVYVITQETSINGMMILRQVIGVYSCYKQMMDTMNRIAYKMINKNGYKFIPEELENDLRRDYGMVVRASYNTGLSEYRFTAYKRNMNETWMAL